MSSGHQAGLSFEAMLYQICQEEGIKLEFFGTNWIKRLTKGENVRFINGHKFDINSYAAGEIADDKCATYEILNANGVPAIEHVLLYNFNNHAHYVLGRNSLRYAEEYFDKHNRNIVIKPARGFCGIGVKQITEREQIMPAAMELFRGNSTLCLSPFYEFKHEHRVILLDGEVRIAYQKSLTPESKWKFNLSRGAIAEEIPAERKTTVMDLALKAALSIGLRFCSVDIAELSNGDMMVLEVNCGVMTSKLLQQHPEKYAEVERMYRSAIRKMFER